MLFNLRPQNVRELFNKRHASLRNVIERTWGVLKKRFPILKTFMEFKIETQVKIVIACCALHNFIKSQDVVVDLIQAQFDASEIDCEQDEEDNEAAFRVDDVGMAAKRDAIAQAMWMDYEDRRRQRR